MLQAAFSPVRPLTTVAIRTLKIVRATDVVIRATTFENDYPNDPLVEKRCGQIAGPRFHARGRAQSRHADCCNCCLWERHDCRSLPGRRLGGVQ